MKLALISDIHSNLEAFEAVLEDIKRRGLKNILCCGDIVGYCANPNECCKLVRDNKVVTVKGNHDQNAVDLKNLDDYEETAAAALRWTNKQLSEENKEFLNNLPKMKSIDIKGLKILLLHGSVDNALYGMIDHRKPESFYADQVERSKSDILAIGHTHIPMIKRVGGNMIVNPGSVGQPRDNRPLASYAVIDTEIMSLDIIRIKYDMEKASKKIITAGLPRYLADRLFKGI